MRPRCLQWLATTCLVILAGCWLPGRDPSAAALSRLAAPGPDRDRLESEVLAALNRARTDPREFSRQISALLPHYTGLLLQRPTASAVERTIEGRSAAIEAIAFLRAAPPLPPVTIDTGLSRAARDHALDQSRTGATGHVGSDGSTFTDRANRHGTWAGVISESIEYGPDLSGLDVVENLIIDDGVPDRGHRRDLLDRAVHVAGVACAPHPTYGKVCVIELASAFKDK